MMTKYFKIQENEQKDKDHTKEINLAYQAFIANLLKQKKISPKDAKEWCEKANDAKNPGLTFASAADAKAFFTERAKAGNEFIACNSDENDNPHGDYFVSDGDGKLHEGRVSPETLRDLRKQWSTISGNPEIKAQAYAALKSSDESKLKGLIEQVQNPAVGMRSTISEMKTTSSLNIPTDSTPEQEEEVHSSYRP
jgi:hypothetical protein